MHTNPVNVLVAGKPIRASRKSALWCIGTIEQLWRVRGNGIAAGEREQAHKTFLWAIEEYRKIAAECPREVEPGTVALTRPGFRGCKYWKRCRRCRCSARNIG